MRMTFPDYDEEVMHAVDRRIDEEVSRLDGRLLSVPPGGLGTYCLGCCERLLPNYAAFHRVSRVGDYPRLRSLIDGAWSALAADQAAVGSHSRELDEIDFVLDAQTSELAVHAANAVHATETALACLPRCSGDAASQCYGIVLRDLVNYLLQSCLEAELAFNQAAEFVFSTEKWSNEVRLNARLAETLGASAALAPAKVNAARAIAVNGGVSNIGLRLS
jgi:uncharacterized protein YjaG (DUF416 family)